MSRAIGPYSSIWGCRYLQGSRARRPIIFVVRTAFVIRENCADSEVGSGTCCPKNSTCCAAGCMDSQVCAISLHL